MGDTAEEALEIIRGICIGLPEVVERPSHGAPTFFVRGKKSFVMVWPEGHHDHGFAHLWAAAPPGAQAELTEDEPQVFFRPPYVGGRGWIGVRLDRGLERDELARICAEAFRTVAPVTLLRQLDGT